MAGSITIGTQDVRALRADLESVELGLGREVDEALIEGTQPVLLATERHTPRGPGPQSKKDNLPHVAEMLYVAKRVDGTAIVSGHPAGGVIEFGGTILPKGSPIHFAPHEMAQRAGDEKGDEVQNRVVAALDRLLRRFRL